LFTGAAQFALLHFQFVGSQQKIVCLPKLKKKTLALRKLGIETAIANLCNAQDPRILSSGYFAFFYFSQLELHF
jgi:hypothetical protein